MVDSFGTSKVAAAILLLLAGAEAYAQPTATVPADLVFADATGCKKPSVAPPPPVKESHQHYHVRRRFLDLDGSGQCVLMDFWVERLGDSDSPGQRTLDHRFLHLVGGKWVPFETDLAYFPSLMRSASTGQAYLVVTPDADIDDIAGGGIEPAVYARGGWKMGDPGMVDTFEVRLVGQGQDAVRKFQTPSWPHSGAAGRTRR